VAIACLILAAPAAAQVKTVSGTVFTDANANGRRDPGESGLPGVVVSNQDDVVVTGADGQYRLPAGPTGIVFVSVPDRYTASSSFWKSSTGDTASFALAPRAAVTTFKFVHASDTHLQASNVPRFRRFRALVDSVHPQLVLFAGDLLYDAMSQTEAAAEGYFRLFETEVAPLSAISHFVPGNHDHYGIIPTRSHADTANPLYYRGMYRKHFGPDYYSFTYGGVHFIGMNSVQKDDSAYFGHIDSTQLAWLARDVEHIPASMPVVTFMHIPMASGFDELGGFIDMALVSSVAHVDGKPVYRHTVSNAVDVIGALQGKNYVLALGAHTHAGEKLLFTVKGTPLRFEQSAGIANAPDLGPMTMRSGFTVYTVKDGRIDGGAFVGLDSRLGVGGMGNGEWGMGNGEWSRPTSGSPFPIPR
jgi:hypothetical protein